MTEPAHGEAPPPSPTPARAFWFLLWVIVFASPLRLVWARSTVSAGVLLGLWALALLTVAWVHRRRKAPRA
ncbi:MAG: hypothetical protein HOO96_09930 [Polyangiaceae bacterium]|nr:hypothetical protein [Polyangiaceae bacterium]